MALTRQVITALNNDGTDMLGTRNVAIKIVDESIVSGSLLTVESNHFCILKSRGAVLQIYETGQYALVTPDKPIVGSVVQGFFGGASPWVYEVIYVNRSKLLVRSTGTATSAEMAEVAYVADYYIHVDSKEAALDLITHLPFNGRVIDTKEIADYAGPAIEQAINQVIQVTKLENINEHINELREGVKQHLTDFLKVFGILLNDLKILILPKDERMRELSRCRPSASRPSRRCATTSPCAWRRRGWCPRRTPPRVSPSTSAARRWAPTPAWIAAWTSPDDAERVLRRRPGRAGCAQPVPRLGL